MDSFEEYPHFFEVHLPLFEGPIDLLLHLVKQKELPIEKLSLAEVAGQYLECLEKMRQFDLEIAGEYLVIAATLLSIKSSYLLDEPAELVEDEDGNLVDPHEELLRRLKEAEIYKEGANRLGSRHLFGIDVFSAPSLLGEIESPPMEYADHDPFLLGKAFQRILSQVDGDDPSYKITLETVSIVERMMDVLKHLRDAEQPVIFYKLIPDLTSRASVIGTFVALLELCKRQAIRVEQSETFQEIVVVLSGLDTDLNTLSSEFDGSIEQPSAPQDETVNA